MIQEEGKKSQFDEGERPHLNGTDKDRRPFSLSVEDLKRAEDAKRIADMMLDSTRSAFVLPQTGLRHNDGKRQWSLVDFDAFEPMVEVLEFGAKKYAPDNWKLGGDALSYRRVTESMLRHIFAFMRGEDIDKESGISHIGHIQCNAMFLGHYSRHKTEQDDRSSKTTKG